MITNCHKNIMGTLSFDGRFQGMNKPQDFIVYPMQDSGEIITIQSEHRFGEIDLATGKAVLSANRAQYANSLWLQICQRNSQYLAIAIERKNEKVAAVLRKRGVAIEFELPAEDVQTLRQWIKSTGGLEVGDSIVKSDNTGALAL